MNYPKLPFKTYTVMSNNLIQKLSCADVFRTYVLLLTADKKTQITDTTIEQLASFTGESHSNLRGGKRSKSFNEKLKETGEVNIRTKKNGNSNRNRTEYLFAPVIPGNYRRISKVFYDSYKELDTKLKGFILKLFSVANPHSYTIKLSIRELATHIHMGHDTISKYMEQLTALNLLYKVEDAIILKVDGLLIDQPKDKLVEKVKANFDSMITFNEKKGSPISRECIIYKKYKDKNFETVKNIRALMKSIQYGYVGRKRENQQTPTHSRLLIL